MHGLGLTRCPTAAPRAQETHLLPQSNIFLGENGQTASLDHLMNLIVNHTPTITL